MEGTLNINSKKNGGINFEDPLFIFIEKNENYQMFKDYLLYCWTEEHLLFYQKVSIIYQIISKYNNDDDDNESSMKYRNKFEHLSSIYTHYQSQIGDMDASKVQFEDLKLKLFNIYQEICDEFIKTGSVNEINIPFEMRQHLLLSLENEESVNNFQSFDDFLHLFDAAIDEIYRLLCTMYNYQFSAWNYTNNWPKKVRTICVFILF